MEKINIHKKYLHYPDEKKIINNHMDEVLGKSSTKRVSIDSTKITYNNSSHIKKQSSNLSGVSNQDKQENISNLNLSNYITEKNPTIEKSEFNSENSNYSKIGNNSQNITNSQNVQKRRNKSAFNSNNINDYNLNKLPIQNNNSKLLSILILVKEFESIISELKINTFDKIKQEIDQKIIFRNMIQTNLTNLENKLKMIKNQRKEQGNITSRLVDEISKLSITEERIQRELYFTNLEIPELKQELGKMNDEISLTNEDLRYIRNDIVIVDKDNCGLKENIKKMNKHNSDLKKENENIKNGINLLHLHISKIKEKLKKQYEQRQLFLNGVKSLINESNSFITNK